MTLTKKQKLHREFIISDEWDIIKENLFKIRGNACEICGSKNVQVHHKHYNKPYGEEQPEDLIILCGYHHQQAHGLIKESKKEKELRLFHEEMWDVPVSNRIKPKKKYKKKKKVDAKFYYYKNISIKYYKSAKDCNTYNELAIILSKEMKHDKFIVETEKKSKKYIVAIINSLQDNKNSKY